jgi:predicted RNase H-like HicB family nuclease
VAAALICGSLSKVSMTSGRLGSAVYRASPERRQLPSNLIYDGVAQSMSPTHHMHEYHYRVVWSDEDAEHVGLCDEFPGLSWLEKTPEAALAGIRKVVAESVAEMLEDGETIPSPRA